MPNTSKLLASDPDEIETVFDRDALKIRVQVLSWIQSSSQLSFPRSTVSETYFVSDIARGVDESPERPKDVPQELNAVGDLSVMFACWLIWTR